MGIALLIENELTQTGVFMIKMMFKSYSHNVQARSASSNLTLTPLAKGDQMKRTVTSDKIVIFFFCLCLDILEHLGYYKTTHQNIQHTKVWLVSDMSILKRHISHLYFNVHTLKVFWASVP